MLTNIKFMIFCLITLFTCGSVFSQPDNLFPVASLKRLVPQYVNVPFGHIEYYEFGQGSPIVLISGYAADVLSWNRNFIAALAQHHQVIVFNNRDVGGSLIRSTGYESKDLAGDIHRLIVGLGLKKPSVLGISMGGMIAQQFAVLYPNELSHLILINTAIAGKQAVHPNAAAEKLLLNMPNSKFGRYKVALKLFFPTTWRLRMGANVIINHFHPEKYTEIQPAMIIPKQRLLVQHWVNDNATAIKIKQLQVPTLILNGESDDVIPPINSIILARTIPHATLIRWREGGHAMIYQFPYGMANAINSFIAN